jgi:hypothetical protein
MLIAQGREARLSRDEFTVALGASVASTERSKKISFGAEVKKTDAPNQARIMSRKTFDSWRRSET